MSNDCMRISANAGFREEAINLIKHHVFIQDHDLIDGHHCFYEDYEMAQSWQRLIDGKRIKEQDIILLNHEYMELTFMAEGLKQIEAHEKAEKIYNYSKTIRGDNA